MLVPEEEREMYRNIILRNNSLNFPKFIEIHESTNSRRWTNSVLGKLKETHPETHYNETSKRQRESSNQLERSGSFHVTLSLSVVMLLVQNAWGIHLGPYYLCQAPTDISLTKCSVAAGLTLVILIMIASCTSATTIREIWKSKLYYSNILEGTQHTWEPHNMVTDWENGPGVLNLLGSSVGCLGFQDSLFIGKFET